MKFLKALITITLLIKGSALGTVSDIKISGVDGDAPYYPGESVLENTINEVLEKGEEKECYVSKTYDTSVINYHIPLSLVTTVEIFSISTKGAASPFSSYSEEQLKISVCDGSSCTDCGKMPNIPASQWGHLDCPEGLKGNTVKIAHSGEFIDNHLIKLCEVRIKGKEMNAVDDIQISGVDGEAPYYPGESVLENTINEVLEKGDEKECYVSKTYDTSVINYHIPLSLVTTVEIFSISTKGAASPFKSYSEEQLKISVCDGSSCINCGKMPNIPASQWGHLDCPEGTKGNTVKIAHTGKFIDNHLIKLCEIRIKGKVIKATTTTTTTSTTSTTTTTRATLPRNGNVCAEYDRVDHLKIASCESIVVKDDTRACKNMYDDSRSQRVKEGACFVSQSSKRGWVEVKLEKTSDVAQVTMLAKSTGTELPGALVEVCQDTSLNCETLNEIGAFDKRFCTNVRGPVLKGNIIRVSIKGSALAICEMRVYSS